MESMQKKKILVSGASIAGLSTAYWMNRLGYRVTVVEIASRLRTARTAIDIKGSAVDIAKRMDIYEQLKLHRLGVEKIEFKNAADETEGSMIIKSEEENVGEEIEIERDKFLHILYDLLKDDVEFIFNNSITSLQETANDILVTFKHGAKRSFELVLGCDGTHSAVRKIWFGEEKEYSYFLGAYFSISIVNKLLVKENTMQMYNVPGKAFMLNAYNNKTDIICCFTSEKEIRYDYKDVDQQRKIIIEKFAGEEWRTTELLQELEQSDNFYFDKFCQVKMPSWTKDRVALLGDAAYAASPAAGMGGSLSMEGAAALADALQQQAGNYEAAFQDYNKNLRPFVEAVQAHAETNVRKNFFPPTKEAIRKRNLEGF